MNKSPKTTADCGKYCSEDWKVIKIDNNATGEDYLAFTIVCILEHDSCGGRSDIREVIG